VDFTNVTPAMIATAICAAVGVFLIVTAFAFGDADDDNPETALAEIVGPSGARPDPDQIGEANSRPLPLQPPDGQIGIVATRVEREDVIAD
jgi:hypothetical protein